MSQGRKKKPAALHVLEGTAQPCRTNTNAPAPEAAIPRCPPWLTDEAKAFFQRFTKEIEPLGMLTKVDEPALVALCSAWGTMQRCEKEIKAAGGESYETLTDKGNKVVRVHPAVATRSQAWSAIRQLSSEFGLTPSSRSKVTVTPKTPGNRWKKRGQ